jgi:hypothetical protein
MMIIILTNHFGTCRQCSVGATLLDLQLVYAGDLHSTFALLRGDKKRYFVNGSNNNWGHYSTTVGKEYVAVCALTTPDIIITYAAEDVFVHTCCILLL